MTSRTYTNSVSCVLLLSVVAPVSCKPESAVLRGPLSSVTSMTLRDLETFECFQQPSGPGSDSLVIACYGVVEDTSFTVVRRPNNEVVQYTRRWKVQGESADSSFAVLATTLEASYGQGQAVCPAAFWQPGRMWLQASHHITIAVARSVDSISMDFALGTPLYDLPCPYVELH